MQASQRTEYNHALEYAINKANQHQKPLLVLFVLTDNFPEANARHYYFMLEGLKEVKNKLNKRKIKMIIRKGSSEKEVAKMAKEALITICDKGYLNIERSWRKSLAGYIKSVLIEVESNLIIPVEKASNKEEYAAYTFRIKAKKELENFLIPLKKNEPEISSLNLNSNSINLDNIDKLIKNLNIEQKISKVQKYQGGSSAAQELLEDFLDNKLEKYNDLSNDPSKNILSGLSPYLHFGQISSLDIALKVIQKLKDNGDAIIIWTCRKDECLKEAISFLDQYEVPYDAVNENIKEIELDFNPFPKIYYDVLIDDRNLGGILPWSQVEKMLL